MEPIVPAARARPHGPSPVAAGRPKTLAFMPIAFLEQARAAASAVGRLVARSGAATGTGFLISPALLITCHHVVPDEASARDTVVELDYELDTRGRPRPVTRFDLDPVRFFVTDARGELDFTVIALGEPGPGASLPAAFGFCPLAERSNRRSLGSYVNLVQHPQGMHKQVVLRENALVRREGTRLYYSADTLGGSSGAPVFNDAWEVVAMHRRAAGADPATGTLGDSLRHVNEGICADAILDALQTLASTLDPCRRALLDVVLEM
jgi:endonuclease G